MVGVDTGVPNRLVGAALDAGALPEFGGYSKIERERNYGERSRVDFLLTHPGRPDLYLEVKSVTLSRTPGLAEFPDARTKRGARHLGELSGKVGAGARAAVLYVVQREDCRRLVLAGDIDPGYAAAAASAAGAGVEMRCRTCRVGPDGVSLDGPGVVEAQSEQIRC